MLEVSFDQECTLKANILISFCYVLVVVWSSLEAQVPFWAKLRQRTSARSLLTAL